MPIEILEKAVAFAIPHNVSIDAEFEFWFWVQLRPTKWDPDWVPGLLVVSKSLRQVARRCLAQRQCLPYAANLSVSMLHDETSADAQ
jgi:hypothetical protein